MKNWSITQHAKGFALVITLMLMILLTVIAVGLLTLSGITLRASAETEALSTARANARLSLQLAIGDLQRQAGCDTLVTARADILDKQNPPVLGVWKTWQGDDHETSGAFAGRPVAPGNYASEKKKRFVAWLTSANTRNATTLPDTSPGDGKVTVIGTGTLGKQSGRDHLQIHLTPTHVGTDRQPGAIAWWIGGENQKARVPRPATPEPATSAGRWAALAKTHPVADPRPFRLDKVLDDPTVTDKLITLGQTDIIASSGTDKTSREFFHDLSAVSIGLLTNPTNGGWRKDLSVLTENWSAQPQSGLPLFRLTPDKDVMFTRPSQQDPLPAGAMLYPWATYRSGNAPWPMFRQGAVASWENLADYATFYKRVAANASGRMSAPIHAMGNTDPSAIYEFIHKVRVVPVIARMQWIFSHSAGQLPSGLLQPRLLMTPVLTMWNPYNMEITVPPLAFGLREEIPVALRYYVNGMTYDYRSVMGAWQTNYPKHLSDGNLGPGSLNYNITSSFLLKPGETRLFSPASTVPVIAAETPALLLSPGFRSGGGHYFPVNDYDGNSLALPGTASIKADAKFDSTWRDFPDAGVRIDMYLNILNNYVSVLSYCSIYPPVTANDVYPPLTNLAEDTLGHCLVQPTPFLSTILGARMASRTNIAAKGFVQSSPFVNFTLMGEYDVLDPSVGRHYGGTGHPVNSPFDYSFVKHTLTFDSQLPNADDTTGRGYIVTGFNKDAGLSRCVIDELPSRPLLSLGELVNWDMRYENPIPPFAFNLIGNSDATPLLPANAVVNAADAGLTVNLQHDDSYCANHLLFDDWFCSGIAPDPDAFGTSGRNQETTYTDALTGKQDLPNKFYQPIPADRAAAANNPAQARKIYEDHVAKTDSWKSIASRLEVEGMFNVNSTSVTAWRALLGHARKMRVPYIRETGGSCDVGLSAPCDYAFTRFSVSGDAKPGDPSTSGAFPEANDFAGYRTLDDKFLSELANQIVNQIRQRGPFLSLSEFVNRQLSSGDLALAGTLEAALNAVTTGADNPLAAVEALSTKSLAVPQADPAKAEYKLPAAAVGYSGYGLPGWTRQADILRPLAPILSIRDDTFTIRAYGDARDSHGHIIARAVCEAVVRRTRNFVDPTDAADILTPPTRQANKTYGRRFQLISFRWLAPDEV